MWVFELYADYFQFYVQDAEADPADIGDLWAEDPETWRISKQRHVVAVGTARYDYVPVVLELFDGPPPDSSFDEAEHVVEADIDFAVRQTGDYQRHSASQRGGTA